MTYLSDIHPLRHRHYLLPTNSIEKLLNSVVQWLDCRAKGAIVYGYSRCGKSEAINFLRGRLNEVLDQTLPIFVLEGTEERNNASNSEYWTSFLEDINNPYASTGSALDKRSRAISNIHAACVESGSAQVLIFVDDAQWYGEKDYARLVDLEKQLRRRHIDLILISVGQEELKLKREQFSGSSRWPIVGRFMQESFHFEGCNLDEDLKRILIACDHDTEFPAGSGISYTQAVNETAWDAGFRLESTHGLLAWEIEQSRLKRTDGLDLGEYPMSVIKSIVNGLLLEISDKSDGNRVDIVTPILVRTSVERYAGAMLGVVYDGV